MTALNKKQVIKIARFMHVQRRRIVAERVWGLGSHTTHSTKLKTPNVVAVDEYGILYVGDMHQRRVYCFTKDGQLICRWPCMKSGWPTAICIGQHHQKWPDMQYALYSVPAISSFPPGIASMCAEYIGNQRIYVLLANTYQVHVFNREGGVLTTWGKKGTDAGDFESYPEDCTIDTDGLLHVTDRLQMGWRIHAFSSDGIWKRTWPVRINHGCGSLRLTAANDGSLWVVVCGASSLPQVQRYTLTGMLIGVWIVRCLEEVNGLTIDHCGRVYLSDRTLKLVVRFQADGEVDRWWGGKRKAGGVFLRSPLGLATDPFNGDDTIYVADSHLSRIQRIGI